MPTKPSAPSKLQRKASARVDRLFNENIGNDRYAKDMFGFGKKSNEAVNLPYKRVNAARDMSDKIPASEYIGEIPTKKKKR